MKETKRFLHKSLSALQHKDVPHAPSTQTQPHAPFVSLPFEEDPDASTYAVLDYPYLGKRQHRRCFGGWQRGATELSTWNIQGPPKIIPILVPSKNGRDHWDDREQESSLNSRWFRESTSLSEVDLASKNQLSLRKLECSETENWTLTRSIREHNKHRWGVYPKPSKISWKLPKSILSKAIGGSKDVAKAWEGELDRDDIPKVPCFV